MNVDKVEIGRKLVGSATSHPLSIGVTFEIFRISGTIPCCEDWLKIWVIRIHINDLQLV